MGSPGFAVPSLEKLASSHHSISAVVSNPDKRRGRRGKPEPTEVKERALELGITTIDVENLKSEAFESAIRKLDPDLLVVVAFRILPSNILDIPKRGSVNLHASLLPKYRGAAPIHWAIINGEKETGCSVFFLDEKVDTGKIIRQRPTPIGPNETTGDLYERLRHEGADLLLKAVNDIAEGRAEAVEQNDELASPAPKLIRENTRIDFNRSGKEVHNFIRGLNPFPVAWCMYNGKKMNIYRSGIGGSTTLPPGKLLADDGKLYAACSDRLIELVEVQLPGTKVLSGAEFINGFDVSVSLE